jgi:hypothetical protein
MQDAPEKGHPYHVHERKRNVAVAGKPDARKRAYPVWREAFGTGLSLREYLARCLL